MLSPETENLITKLLLGIASGDKNINTLKHSLFETSTIDPIQLFLTLDKENKDSISSQNIYELLHNHNIPSSFQDIQSIILFYDINGDGLLNFKEFLNLLISDNDYFFKKYSKSRYKKLLKTPQTLLPLNDIGLTSFIEIIENEMDFIKYISEIINELKTMNDFTLQNLFYSIKSYSYITNESIRAFFDKNGINYTNNDIKCIFNRMDYNKDGKISFNDLKALFSLNNNNNTIIEGNNSLIRSLSTIHTNNNNNDNIPKQQYHYTYNNDDHSNDNEEFQYECVHLSRSGSPVHRCNSNSKPRSPIINKPICDGRNNPYKIYHREYRETSLNRSKSRSLSRSSEYQSPGKKNESNCLSFGNYTTNIHTYKYNKCNDEWKGVQMGLKEKKRITYKNGELYINNNYNNDECNYVCNKHYGCGDLYKNQRLDTYSYSLNNNSNNKYYYVRNMNDYRNEYTHTYEMDKSF
jgi:Ca2+-binding EF-hand superfamily protein